MATESVLLLNQSHGSLLIRTTVEGRAARMGHRLTLEVSAWTAEVELTHGQPTSAVLHVDLSSIEVMAAEGGVTPLTPVDRSVIKRNANKSLKTDKHPEGVFEVPAVSELVDGQYELRGTLTLANKSAPFTVTLHAEREDSAWTISTGTSVRQSDFGIKPYSLMVGAVRVGDEVAIEFHATFPADLIS